MLTVHDPRVSSFRLATFVGCFVWASSLVAAEPIVIDDRRELFVDDYLIERLGGEATQVLQIPEPHEVVLTCDRPWEGNTSAYFTVLADGEEFKMYYRGSQLKTEESPSPEEVTCLAVSDDGIHWTRPELNLFEFNGSKANNIVWFGTSATHNFVPFKDGNPATPPEARYKAIGGKGKPRAYESADGLHWKMVADRALVTKGTFDSQNIAFWDAARNQYRLYWRINPESVRGIRTAASTDFVKFVDEADLTYPGKAPPESLPYLDRVQLYTNAVQPYARAPHLFVGFPTQFIQKGKQTPPKFYQTQPLFMSSRDGVEFQRWDEPVIPTTAPKERDGNRGNYMAWGMLQLPDNPREISVYATEAGRDYGPNRLRRFTYRADGFVSVTAGTGGGELLTKPLVAAGKRIAVNYKTADKGTLRVEMQDAAGRPLPGFALADCEPLTGDEIDAVVRWKEFASAKDSSDNAAPFRIRFVFNNAAIYSFQCKSTAEKPALGRP